MAADTLSRPFGCVPEDLEFDFAHADRPVLVTQLLAACAGAVGECEGGERQHGWWHQPVGARIAALLSLLRASDGHESRTVTLRCPGCDETFEIELSHQAIAALQPAPADVKVPRDGAAPLTLRLPTGDDLRAWRTQEAAPRDETFQSMLARLCVGAVPQPGDERAAAEALALADPLVSFTVECACPTCGAQASPEVDLEGLALRHLAARQRSLLHEVHVLASRYGWTEAEILAIAPARRAKYLDLIEGSV